MVVFFMSPTTEQRQWMLAAAALTDAYTDFMLSRQAMNCTKATLKFYSYTAGKFLQWVEQHGVTSPEQVTARYIREYLAELIGTGKQDTTVHDNARAIRTLLRFWHAEGYIPAPVKFDMPKLAKKRLPVLTAEQLQTVLKYCDVRDKAIILFMVDSGLRRAEVCALNWEDVDMQNGLVRVKRGKGQKDRSAVVSPTTRRALVKYRRTLQEHNGVLFRTNTGKRFTGSGFLRIFQRLTKETGIHITPHAMRRTFAILSLRAGMDVLHLQALGGWSALNMVAHYAQMVDEDLLQAHSQHSPVEHL
jgi:integrase/recombinase XerD